MAHVPTTNINALYANTTSSQAADPNLFDAAMQDIVNTVNTNDDSRSGDLTTHKTAATLDHPDASVTTPKLADAVVTTSKLAPQSVTLDKLSPDIQTSGQPEVALARVSVPSNKTYDTLKARLDDEIGTLQADNTQYIKATGVSATDDVNLQAAVNSAATAKRDLVLLGQFVTSASINVPSNSNISFAAGSKITNNSDNSIFTHSTDLTNANITIRNACIEGNHTGDVQYAILFSGVSNVRIEGCGINYTARGIRLDDCPNLFISENIMTINGFTSSATNQNSILVQGTSTGIIQDNFIYDGTGSGIKVNATGDMDIINNTAWRCSAIGIIAASVIHVRMIISKNSCCYCGTSVTSGAEGGLNVHGLTNGIISENICCYNYNYGIDINGDIAGAATFRTDMLIVSNNVITNNNSIGLYVFESKRVIIDANVLHDNDCNIKVSGANSSEISITNNKLYDITFNVNANSLDINQGSNILVENNYFGEINSAVTTIIELNIGSGVTGGIKIGWNDYALAKRAKCVNINATRDKVDFKHKQIWVSDEITLSAAAFNSPVLLNPPTGKYSCIWKAYAVYTEATSANTGVTIGIGRNSVGNETYWATITTEISKAINTRTALTINRNGQLTDTVNDPWFYCIGGKTGLGKCKIVIEYLPDVPIYF